jgi:hypothetical protein
MVVMVLGGWLFGAIAEDVVHQDPLVQVDRVVSHFLSAHTEPPFTAAMRVISLAVSMVLLVASLALAIALAWRQWWRDLILLVLAVGGGAIGCDGRNESKTKGQWSYAAEPPEPRGTRRPRRRQSGTEQGR